jgi:hypothetical protein
MSQNKTYASSLTRSVHFLSAYGDLLSQYVPWHNPPTGNPRYSYLKTDPVTDSTELQMVLTNRDDSGKSSSVMTFSYAMITQDVDLYASPSDNPNVKPPAWLTPAIGTSGVVTVNPGGKTLQRFTVATPLKQSSGSQITLAVRVLLNGAPVKLEAYCPSFVEMY